MSVKQTTVLIECTAESHEPIPIRRFKVLSRDGAPWGFRAAAQQTIIDGRLQRDDERIGRHSTADDVDWHSMLIDTGRQHPRWSLECPRCGLRADMRKETARALVEECANLGVFRVSLAYFVASL